MTQADLKVGLYERQHEPQSTETQGQGLFVETDLQVGLDRRLEPPGAARPSANSGYQLPRRRTPRSGD